MAFAFQYAEVSRAGMPGIQRSNFWGSNETDCTWVEIGARVRTEKFVLWHVSRMYGSGWASLFTISVDPLLISYILFVIMAIRPSIHIYRYSLNTVHRTQEQYVSCPTWSNCLTQLTLNYCGRTSQITGCIENTM